MLVPGELSLELLLGVRLGRASPDGAGVAARGVLLAGTSAAAPGKTVAVSLMVLLPAKVWS